MLPTLPDKYYLSHAHELFDFVEHQCAHLLQPEQREYIAGFSNLSENAQCLLVRFLARKPRYLKRVSLDYPEIDDIEAACAELAAANFIATPNVEDWPNFSAVLTKPQLLVCLEAAPVRVKRSAPKAELLTLAQQCLRGDEPPALEHCQQFYARRQQATVDYILFLFFGDLRNRLQKFAMRDLGVLKTRKKGQPVARFESLNEARSAFELQLLRRRFLSQPQQTREQAADYLLENPAQGGAAQETHDRLLLAVGDAYAADAPDRAIALWRNSNEPQAIEKWVRETYRSQDKATLQAELSGMREQQLAAPAKIFIEDFYARKFEGKRTSVFTDMLREPARVLPIDQAFLNSVEDGAIGHYQQRGIDAWFTENRHWRVLFGLTFWPLLFGREQLQHSEFDRLPPILRHGRFYREYGDAIEQCLAQLDDRLSSLQLLTRRATQHYGYPSGLFRWRAGLLDSIKPCIEFAPPGALANVLRRMAQDYRHTRDGYPDLMVVQDGALRFEEIKAPGDVLRPNQLVSINRLRRAGLRVDVTQIEWSTDPNQCYAVVDIETTGGRRGLHNITEIAVVKVQGGKVIEQWSTLVNPERSIPAHITRLTRITNEMVAGAPKFQDIADQLEAQLEGCIFVAHNVGFDYGFIKAAFERMNRGFRHPKYCTVRQARKAFPGMASYSLGNLCQSLDIDLNNAHRALSDATATAHLLLLIQQQGESQDCVAAAR
ncbi:MAG: DNA polymerase III subunit epsilon [Gammaproteobacteria bacterium]|nr:DNA polymerase III subunit epsilon [Gammaproteobacteria bacterium]